MFEKSGRFFADWRDQRGQRKRKSFHTERAALTFEAEQKELAHPKTMARGKRSPASYSPSSAPHRAALISFKPRVSSSEHADRSARSNSAPLTSKTSTVASFKADSRAAQKPLALVRSVASSAGSGKTTARQNSTATSAATPGSARATTRPPAKKSTASSRQRRRT
ncbi:hypothetical protein P8935_01275 [Telmatobacter sp. DSM 110680]|uniref:Uncharacterized protein n=1 Tax=Telmatobacter sp. DSM 110680 TaxID=3036704 RepID=A0AAU7DLL9_9BACT